MNFESIVLVNKKAGEAVRHIHSVWELILTIKGEGDIVVDGRVFPFRHGTVVCVPPGAVHYNTSKNDYSQISIRVKGFIKPTGKEMTSFQDDDDKTFENIAKIALKMFYRQDKASAEAMRALCDALCALLAGAFEEKKTNPEVEAIKDICISNFVNPEFKIADAFKNINYSDGHFRRLFKKEMGMTPGGYLMSLRLEYAKKQLEENAAVGVKILYVALRSGFYDQRYFSRVFKAYTNMTPQEYLRKFAMNENNE